MIGGVAGLTTNTGTLHYKAPEMFGKFLYAYSIDVWAVGVILFALASGGSLPFDDESQFAENIVYKIQKEAPAFEKL
jgi:serine/threonine protein kinase